MTEQNSYRSILRSSAVIGASQIVSIAGGLVRMKAVAVLAGPTGVGLVGLYMSLVQVVAIAAALGTDSAGTRQIATAHAGRSEFALGRARRALFWGTHGLAFFGLVLVLALADWLASFLSEDPARSADVRWLALGVAIAVATGYQTALLTGTRRIGDLARISIFASVTGTLIACAALWFWRQDGLVAIVLAPPAMTLILGYFLVRRIELPEGPSLRPSELLAEWKGLIRLGLAFTLTGVLTLLGHLLVRVLVQQEAGSDALGHFQAAWTISSTCLGLVLAAMGTDYFPRLTASINNPILAVQMVNEQTEVGLLLCAPLLLALLGLAPWVVTFLYSADFRPATDILRFQLLGDLLKVLSWPLGFVMVARGAGATFVLTEAFAIGLLLALIGIGMPEFGLVATGIAFLAMNAAYVPIVWWFGGRPIGFRWSTSVKLHSAVLLFAAVLVDLASRQSAPLGAISGGLAACAFGGLALVRLSHRGARLSSPVRAAGLLSWWRKND